MTPRIENAINVFLDALNEGTLAKGSCYKCAVGNLCRDGMIKAGAKIINREKVTLDGLDNSDWMHCFYTSYGLQKRNDSIPGRKVLSYTEFTEDELAQIEYAFETATLYVYGGNTKEEIRANQIKGLEAVVKLMLTFEDQSDSVEEVFTNRALCLTI